VRALVTGASGTIGSGLCSLLKLQGHDIFTWDRIQIPIDDYYKMENFVKLIRPDVLFHIAYTQDPNQSWFVNYEWSSELAWITHILHIRFVFISTNLVFSHRQQGPFTLHSVPDAFEGYGFEKRKSEERVSSQNPEAIIARLGWQIRIDGGGNNMIEYFRKRMADDGVIRASIRWYPACSFVEDACSKLIEMATIFPSGICMLDSNEKWNLFEIASALNEQFHFNWKIEPSEEYGWDSRMIDERMNMPSLRESLPLS